MNEKHETRPIRSYTRKELLQFYGVTHQTFARWIEKLDLKHVKVFTPKQIKAIFLLLGPP